MTNVGYEPFPGSLLTPVTWIPVSLCPWSHYAANHVGRVLLALPAHACICGHAATAGACTTAGLCAWLPVQKRAAGVTAPLPKVMSKESRANYYADQSWWRLRGLLRCNHISWPERNLQADPNHRGCSAGVSGDGELPPMFSFHKTLFPYLEQPRDYQAKQPSWVSCRRALAYIYIFFFFFDCIWITTFTV